MYKRQGVELDDFDEIIEDSLDDYDDEAPLDEESSLDKDNNQPKLEEYSVHLLSSYDDLNVLIDLAGILNDEFSGESSLYKSPLDGRYYLNVLFTSKDEFFVARARGLISEYGRTEDVTAFKPAYLNAVSYTHLDVYKRQISSISPFILGKIFVSPKLPEAVLSKILVFESPSSVSLFCAILDCSFFSSARISFTLSATAA